MSRILRVSMSLATAYIATEWLWNKPVLADLAAKIAPPVPTRRPFAMDAHGQVRIDEFYWLRDNSRSDREIIDHLERENEYVDSTLADTKGLQQFPYRKGPYYYYQRMETGKQFPIYCRRRVVVNDTLSVSVGDKMDESQPEEILLDANQLAAGYENFRVGAFEVSTDHSLLAYAYDTSGAERYVIRFKNLNDGTLLDDIIRECSGDIAWANDNETLFYLTKDNATLYRERDDAYYLSLHKSPSDRFIYLHCRSAETSEVSALDANRPNSSWKVLLPRKQGVDYDVCDRENYFYYLTNENAPNRKICLAPLSNPDHLEELIPHHEKQERIVLEDFRTFVNHLVVLQRRNGLQEVAIYTFDKNLLSSPHLIHFPEEAYSLSHLSGEYHSSVARIEYSSLACPNSVYDIDLNTYQMVLKWRQGILHTRLQDYVTKRLWAPSRDGANIPVSIVYKKDLFHQDGTSPLLLEGYGAYEISNDPVFDSGLLSLLDRGVVFAIAHVRGGGELGREWYEQGKYLNKKNTFTDFLDVCNYLLEQKYSSAGKVAISGRSAGGLLIGATLNMAPEDLFCGAFAGVPFVDVLTTMLDDTIPLTIKEREEWGDPRQKEYYDYILSYSPYDNIQHKKYPPILVTAGLHDPRVGYWEPAKWVLKLRDCKKDDYPVLLKVNLDGGHFSKSGRYDRLLEDALQYAFLLQCWGIHK
ncbi:Dipeptidyl aminopeptidase BI [Galdieria sulphuraria]|nr:Dipeptidyl aminopeptidase BI [Galdieria sulphuraria]